MTVVAGTAWLLVFLGVYVTSVGHGFVQDDFRWVDESRLSSPLDAARLFVTGKDNDFYRPVVSLTFGLDHVVFGMRPRGYGLTNVALALGVAGAVWSLAVAYGLSRGAAVAVSAMWLMNLHGIRWALLWISGRTSLLLCLFAVLAVQSALKSRPWRSLLFVALALGSKEEAVALPAILAGSMYLMRASIPDWRHTIVRVGVGSAVVLVAYFVLRSYTSAMTLGSAPGYYAFTLDPLVVLDNAAKGADRALTFAVVVVLAGIAILGRARVAGASVRPILLCAGLWVAAGYALTLFLPVRSELYACLPAIGAALAAGVLLDRAWQQASAPRRRAALLAASIAPFLLAPVYLARTERWVGLAELSTQAVSQLEALTRSVPAGGAISIEDGGNARRNLGAAFGSELQRAMRMMVNRDLNFEIRAAGTPPPPCEGCDRLLLRLDENGVLRRPAP